VSAKKRDCIFAALIFVLSCFYYHLYFNYGLFMTDEGTLIQGAARILREEVPYRDYYLYYPPGRFYLVAFLFKIFGESLLITRWMWLFFKAGTVVLVYLISRKLLSFKFALIPTLIILIVPGPWFKSFYTFFPLIVLWPFLNYLDRRKIRWLAAGGLINGVAILFRHDVGLAAALTVVCGFLLASCRRYKGKTSFKFFFKYIGFYSVFTAFVLFPAVLFLVSKKAFLPMLHQIFTLTVGLVLTKKESFLRLLIPGTAFAQRFFFILPLFIFLLAALFFLRNARKKEFGTAQIKLFCCTFLGMLVLIPAYFPVAWVRLMQAVPLIFITGVFFLERFYRWSGKGKIFPLKIVIYLLTLAIPFYYILVSFRIDKRTYLGLSNGGVISVIRRNYRPYKLRGETFYLKPKKARTIKRIVAEIKHRTEASEPILVLPTQSLFYYLSDRPNPTRFIGLWMIWYPHSNTGKRLFFEYKKDLKKFPGRIVVIRKDFFSGIKSNPLRLFFKKYFRRVFERGSFLILEKKDTV